MGHLNISRREFMKSLLATAAGLGLSRMKSVQALPLQQESSTTVFLPLVSNDYSSPPLQSQGTWQMAGANPERTSWTWEEVRGKSPLWFKPFEAYILPRVQIITANDTLYISTAKGLYALNAENGDERWVYPTELPLGHSPTIHNEIAYVGGYDHKLHAVDALTGKGLWTFEAGAGFETNPLAVNNKVYLGNRDGWFYAIDISGPNTGQLAWKYKTQGPVCFSAAYKDGIVFFASNDSHAYALNAQDGGLVWKSAKMPGAGFQSWWPVVYRDRVIFPGGNNYRVLDPGPIRELSSLELEDVFPNHKTDPRGTLVGPRGQEPGDWVEGTPTINATRILNYFNVKPWRRRYFVLDRFTGEEREIAPVLWTGTQSGNRYPPVIGSDGVIYQQNCYMSDPYIAGSQISGWKIGTPFISVISSVWGAVDEPRAFSAGGNLIYWNLCVDRQAGATNITKPNTSFSPPNGPIDSRREWFYFNYKLPEVMPGYNQLTFNDYGQTWMVYGSPDGVYGYHGDQNPPIPYKGKIFMHRSNAILAFGSTSNPPAGLPMAKALKIQNASIHSPNDQELKTQLAEQVQKMIDAGHLQPGYITHGLFDIKGRDCADRSPDYFHHPGDTLLALIQALPYLPAALQASARTYLQNEFTAYPPYQYNHIGWRDGLPREVFDRPPEIEVKRAGFPPQLGVNNFDGWSFAPHSFYALWKYAEAFGGAPVIYEASHNKLPSPPSNDVLIKKPHVQNAFIAGYTGYLELEKLAGQTQSSNVQSELERLKALRLSSFSLNTAYGIKDYCRTLTAAQNFMYLVPETADFLRAKLKEQVQNAISEYEKLTPCWFVSRITSTFSEGVIHPLYDAFTIFQAKAMILRLSRQELTKFLDVPAFEVGDLFYIEKLILLLQANP